MHLIGSLFSIALAFILAGFAFMNMESVSITWSPFHEQVSLPLYMVCCTCAAFGFLFGSILTWLYGHKTRKVRREQKRTIKNLEKKIQSIESTVANDQDDHIENRSSRFLPLGN